MRQPLFPTWSTILFRRLRIPQQLLAASLTSVLPSQPLLRRSVTPSLLSVSHCLPCLTGPSSRLRTALQQFYPSSALCYSARRDPCLRLSFASTSVRSLFLRGFRVSLFSVSLCFLSQRHPANLSPFSTHARRQDLNSAQSSGMSTSSCFSYTY